MATTSLLSSRAGGAASRSPPAKRMKLRNDEEVDRERKMLKEKEEKATRTIQTWLKRHPLLKYRGREDALTHFLLSNWRDVVVLVEDNGCDTTFSARSFSNYFRISADFTHPTTRRELHLCEVMRVCRIARETPTLSTLTRLTYKNRADVRKAMTMTRSLPCFLEEECGNLMDEVLSRAEVDAFTVELLKQTMHSSSTESGVTTTVAEDNATSPLEALPTATDAEFTRLLAETSCEMDMLLQSYARAVRLLHKQTQLGPAQLSLNREMVNRRQHLLMEPFLTNIHDVFGDLEYYLDPSNGTNTNREPKKQIGLEIWIRSLLT